MTRVERLTNYTNVKPENISFGSPKVSNVPERGITYERIPISIKHGNGTYGSLLIKTEKCFSFGVQQNLDKETGEITGWSLPIAMYDRLEPTLALGLGPIIERQKGGGARCQHGRIRRFCKPCGGSAICPHGIRKYVCKPCGGSQLCKHFNQKHQCRECKREKSVQEPS